MDETHLKILLLGDSAVGKTSLLLRFTKNTFLDSHVTTMGIDCFEKKIKINEKNVVIHLTDTSGQERFRSLSKNFYKNADGIIFVFDLTNHESFVNINDWLNEIKSYNDNFLYVIAGNKADLQNTIQINEQDIQENDIFKNIKYFQTSAKENTNVDKTFIELTDLILQKLLRQGSISSYEASRSNSIRIMSFDGSNHRNRNKKKCCGN